MSTKSGEVQPDPSVFTQNIKDAVLNQDRGNLFEKYDSYMIGSGEIWFDLTDGIHDVANNAGYSVADCSHENPEPLPEKYYGTWEVYRSVVIGGSMSDALIQSAMGKHIVIKKNEWVNETKLWSPSEKGVEWLSTVEKFSKDGDYPECTLAWYGRPEAFSDQLIWVFPCGNGQKEFFLEITNDGELAFFYDGHFIFLKKVKEPAS